MGFLYIHILAIPNVKVMMSEDYEKNYFDTLGFAHAKIKPSTKSPNSPTGRAARAVLNEQQWQTMAPLTTPPTVGQPVACVCVFARINPAPPPSFIQPAAST